MKRSQSGDPKKATKVVIDFIRGEGYALRKPISETLRLGPDLLEVIRKKCKESLEILP